MTPLMASVMLLVAVVYLLGVMWRVCEGLLQGTVGGVRLFMRLARAMARCAWRAGRTVYRYAGLLDDELARRVHTIWFVYSYRLRRAYIAGALRARRHAR